MLNASFFSFHILNRNLNSNSCVGFNFQAKSIKKKQFMLEIWFRLFDVWTFFNIFFSSNSFSFRYLFLSFHWKRKEELDVVILKYLFLYFFLFLLYPGVWCLLLSKNKSRPFILAFLCGYAKKKISKLLYILNTCYASISALPIKSNHPVLFDVYDFNWCVYVWRKTLCLLICWMFWFSSVESTPNHPSKKNEIPINLVFFKGWSITLRCHSNRRWPWVEPGFYHRQLSTDSSQREWAAVCQADGIPIPTKKIGASKGWTMIHDFHFVDQTSTEQTIHNTIDACAPRNIAIIHHLKGSIFKMPSNHSSNIIKLNSIEDRAIDK